MVGVRHSRWAAPVLLGCRPSKARHMNRNRGFTVYMPAEGGQAMPPLVAVYFSDWGWVSRVHGPQVLLAIWRDGRIVWSLDPIKGGPPYRTGRLAPQKLEALLGDLDQRGLFQ